MQLPRFVRHTRGYSFLMEKDKVLFARTPYGVLDAEHVAVRVQGSLFDALGLPQDLKAEQASDFQGKGIKRYLDRLHDLRERIAIEKRDHEEDRLPGDAFGHPRADRSNVEAAKAEDAYIAERAARITRYQHLLVKPVTQTETPVAAAAAQPPAGRAGTLHFKVEGVVGVFQFDLAQPHESRVVPLFFQFGPDVRDPNGKVLAAKSTARAFAQGLGLSVEPFHEETHQDLRGLLTTACTLRAFDWALAVEPVAVEPATAAKGQKAHDDLFLSRRDTEVLFGGLPKPNANSISTSEEADEHIALLEQTLKDNRLHPTAVRSVRGWIKGWKDLRHRYSMDFGGAGAQRRGPSATSLARKAARQQRDADIRKKMVGGR